MYSNETALMKAIKYLESLDISKMNEEKEYAVQRCFEIIGGELKNMVSNKDIVQTDLIKNWIRTRDKISHFYQGINHSLLLDSINTLKELKKDIKK